MKNATSIGMLAAIAFGVGMVGLNFSEGTIALQNDTPVNQLQTGSITGHLELVQTDRDGNIKSYQQTDNAIMVEGMNCANFLLFGANSGCHDTTPSFTQIVLGNGTLAAGQDQTYVQGPLDSNGMAGQNGTLVSFTNATTGQLSSVQRIQAVFTNVGCGGSSCAVNHAALSNTTDHWSGAPVSTFALKNFSPIQLSDADVLTVNWDITITGSSGIGP